MSRLSRVWWLLPAVASLAGCEGCGGENFQEIKPQIAVDKCTERGIKECVMEFGSLSVNRDQVVTLNIKSIGENDLHVQQIKMSDTSDPAFSIEGATPTTIAPAAAGDVTIRFRPSVASQASGTLIIVSDAGNLDEGQTQIEVSLTGAGLEVGVPDLTVNPAQCDFGEVAVGVAAFCDVSIGNNGTLELSIVDVGFEASSDPVFSVAGVFPIPVALPPGSATTIRVQFRPILAQGYVGAIFLDSSDPAHAHVVIPLTGTGGASPTAVARVESVNGNPTSEASPQVRPLDDVVVTGIDSAAGTAGRTIVGYAWELIEKPSGSTVVLTAPAAVNTGFRFNSSGQNREGLDVAGTYTVKLTVTDSAGQSSTNDARVTFTAVPSEDLHIQLTWDDANSDMDLHLVRGLGPRFSATNDCYYQNCKTSAGLNWGGGAANPHLDVDDTTGFGPENINIEQPEDNTFTVGVHWFSATGSPQITCTVKVFVQGALLGEYIRTLNTCNQYWEVTKIIWGSTATLQDLNSVAMDSHGYCGGL